jgi:hypothetical protein
MTILDASGGVGEVRSKPVLGLVLPTASCLLLSLLLACTPATKAASWVPADYASWRPTTTTRLDYPIPGHEDNFRVIYMNDTGFGYAGTSVSQTGRIIFPEGTIIAKAIYAGTAPSQNDEPVMVTAMIKAADDPAARGGWVWVMKDLVLGKETVVPGDFCYTCHANANEAHPYGDRNPNEDFRDFVFFIP